MVLLDSQDEKAVKRMSGRKQPSGQKKKRGGIFPVLCNVAGMAILLVVIGSCLMLVVPRFLGYEAYNIVSGSMEPEIPIGSLLYVGPAAPEEIQKGDVIAFVEEDNSIITHRVEENNIVEGQFITKGDANEGEDLKPVSYANFRGKGVWHCPVLGDLLIIYATNAGKLYAIVFAGSGVMLNILAGRIRANRKM